VMLSLGYGCGLRAGEFVRLKAGEHRGCEWPCVLQGSD
jgi:hypothetical protein